METWTSGYVADIGYTFGYYQEMNPLRAKLAFLSKGLVFPEVKNACELGFGQGISINIHGAASQSKWIGTDFNPSQAGLACELASMSKAQISIQDSAFSDFCSSNNLPDFDFIALHGIWSWISDQNREIIVDFIRRKLSLGGVLYISYNTLPGWATFAPMRELMTHHASVIGSGGKGIVSDIDEAVKFAEDLLEINPLFSRSNPQITNKLEQLKDKDRHYLAHEYFNKDWHPMHFRHMEEWLEPAKISYACSAHFLDHIDNVNLTKEQQGFLEKIPNPSLREATRDFIINQQFRRDYWVRGRRVLSPLEQSEQFQSMNVILAADPADISLKISGAQGETNLNKDLYEKVIRNLSNYKPTSIANLAHNLKEDKISLGQLFEIILVLSNNGNVAIANPSETAKSLKKQTDRLNIHLLKKARNAAEINYLASPVTGGGIAVSRFNQLFLLAHLEGMNTADNCAEYAWKILKAQGQRLVREGETLQTDEENLSLLKLESEAFFDRKLKPLKSLGII